MIEQDQITLDFSGPELTPEEALIASIVKNRRGAANAIKSTTIQELTGIGNVRLRAIIAHLINNHDMFIGSSQRGYFVPVTPEETEEALKNLGPRAMKILFRMSKIKRLSLDEVFRQERMKFEKKAS